MTKPNNASGTAPAQTRAADKVPEQGTGLPWLRTWPAVYSFVLAGFLLWLGLLYALSVAYR